MLIEDQEWIHEQFNELVDKYTDKYVSVACGKLVAVGGSVKDRDEAARAKHPKVVPSVLRVPKEEDFECLL